MNLFLSRNSQLSCIRIFLISTFYLCFSFYGQSQVNHEESASEKQVLIDQWEAAQGTFQFQIVNSRRRLSIDIHIIEEIEKSRSNSKDVIIPFQDLEDVRIYIISKDKISQGGYGSLELIKYVNE